MGNWSTKEGGEHRNRVDPSCSYALEESEPKEEQYVIPLVHAHPVLSMCPADSSHIITGSNDNVQEFVK